MNKLNAKKIKTTLGIDNNLANKYLRGVCRPSYEKMIILRDSLDIPLGAWEDINIYLSYINNTKSKGATTSLQKDVS